MIHTLLHLTRPLLIFDLETTGLNEQDARIIEIGFQEFIHDGIVAEWQTLINPGVPITNSDVHGISTETVTLKCRRCRRLGVEHPTTDLNGRDCLEWQPVPTFAQVAQRLATKFSACDFGGKNIRYDLRVMAAEMKRHRIEWSYAGACIIDADRLEQIGEPRTLSHLYKKHTGQDLEDAHQALVDVRASAVVIAHQLRTYRDAYKTADPRVLHELQWPGWIDAEGKFRFNEQGAACCHFGKHRGVLMRNIPPSYYRWLIEADFPADVKALANDALVGKFPIAGGFKLE